MFGSGLPPILSLGVILVLIVLIQPGLDLGPGGAAAGAVTPCFIAAPITHHSHSVVPVIAQDGSVEERMSGAERSAVVAVPTRAEADRVSPRLQVGHSPHHHRSAEEEFKRTRGSGCTNVSLYGAAGVGRKRAIPRVERRTQDNQLTVWVFWVADPTVWVGLHASRCR